MSNSRFWLNLLSFTLINLHRNRWRTTLSTRPFIYHLSVSYKLSFFLHLNAADAKPSIYNPIKDYEKLVLAAINIGTAAMNRADESELKEAIMSFVSEYGMLGLMTAFPTTPDFITYEAVYLPKNHFIRKESISTEKYLPYFFPFDKIDFHKKGIESG